MVIWVHIIFGCLAIGGMLAAMLTKKGHAKHKKAGRVYVFGMGVSLLAAFSAALTTENVLLGLIALFSAYWVYTGLRLAVLRDGVRRRQDHVATLLMLGVAAVMCVQGVYWLWLGNDDGILLLVFGLLGGWPALSDWRRVTWPQGKARIAQHLIRMGGASIATMTAVVVVNIQTNPAWIAWLAPTLIGSVLISYALRRQKSAG